MKTKLLVTIALSFCAVAFAQRKELRNAEKAVESGDFAEAKAAIQVAEGTLGAMDAEQKEEFYFLKGQAFLGNENKNMDEVRTSLEAYKMAMEANGGKEYGEQAQQGMQQAVIRIINAAVDDQNAENFDAAADKLYEAYTYSKKDTSYLYFAASNEVNAKDYDTALKYYKELNDLGYTGEEIKFFATNKETGEEEPFNTELERDLSVKSGEYIKPEKRMSESRKAEITKNIALIYISQDKNEEALEALAEAKKENPSDELLDQVEADIYLKTGNTAKYEETMEKKIAKDPNNPEVYYNLGVSAGTGGNKEKAMDYYKKALEIDPTYTSANINLAAILLEDDQAIIEQMNQLGTSRADNAKYDELKKKRFELYRSALPYLERALESSPDNKGVVQTLFNIHSQLGEQEKANAYKTQLDNMQEGN